MNTPRPGKLPNAFLLGAPKCGTTAVASYLETHPSVFFSHPKEPNFFNTDHDREFRHRFGGFRHFDTLEQYAELFESAGQKPIRMEGSVMYLCSDRALDGILEVCPEARFVILLRDPVEMVVSLHAQNYWAFIEDEASLERAWFLQEERRRGRAIPRLCQEPALLQYTQVCSLADQVERVLARVPKERVHLALLEDFRNDARSAYLALLDFLGVPDDGRSEFPRVNSAKAHRIRRLNQWVLREDRFSLVRPLVWKLNISKRRPPPLTPRLRAALGADLLPQRRRLAELVGREIPSANGDRVEERGR